MVERRFIVGAVDCVENHTCIVCDEEVAVDGDVDKLVHLVENRHEPPQCSTGMSWTVFCTGPSTGIPQARGEFSTAGAWIAVWT
jgi:hypothetical protein